MKNYIITLIGVSALALAFTGCGGSAGSTSSTISTPSVDSSSVEKPNLNLAVTNKPAGLTEFPDIPQLPEN